MAKKSLYSKPKTERIGPTWFSQKTESPAAPENETPAEKQKRKYIERQKRLRKLSMPAEKHRNTFESGDDHYFWLKHYQNEEFNRRYGAAHDHEWLLDDLQL